MMRQTRSMLFALLLGLAPVSPWSAALAAPALTSLYSFHGGADGAGPVAGLIGDATGSALYGTTPAGGGIGCKPQGCGTVFKLTPPSTGQTQWTETVLYSFTGGADGSTPLAGLAIDGNGILYGTTSAGGAHGVGTVFTLTPPSAGQTAWTESVIYPFKNDGVDGTDPVAPVLIDKLGNLYGTTNTGGIGYGTVFRLSPPAQGEAAWTETQLEVFPNNGLGGGHPTSGVIADSAGSLYGTTMFGASSGGCGSVFQLTPGQKQSDPWAFTTLVDFEGCGLPGLRIPTGLLFMDAMGTLYDTSVQASASWGSVFTVTPPVAGQTAWETTLIYNFADRQKFGTNPDGGVIADSVGNLYGTTAGGNLRNKLSEGATIFKLTPPAPGQTTWTKKVLAYFDGTNGALPKSGLLLTKDGTLYGTAQAGGTYGFGTVFALARPGK